MKRFILCVLALLLFATPVYAGFADRFNENIDEYSITVDMSNISSSCSVWVPVSQAGKVTKVYSTVSTTPTVANAVISVKKAGTTMTGGTITITAGSVAGTMDSCTPTENNSVSAGDIIEISSNGGSSNEVRGTFTIMIARSE